VGSLTQPPTPPEGPPPTPTPSALLVITTRAKWLLRKLLVGVLLPVWILLFIAVGLDRLLKGVEGSASERPWRPPLDGLGRALFYKALLKISPSWWFSRLVTPEDRRPTEAERTRIYRVLAGYLLLTTGGLVALWQANPGDETTQTIFGALAAWRLLEILTYGIGIAFKLGASRLDDWVSIALYAFSVTIIYAILGHSFATHGYMLKQTHQFAERPFDFLYISWTQMTTLGNEYELVTRTARWLSMAAATSGLLILAVLVAGAVNKKADQHRPDENKSQGQPEPGATAQGESQEV
jgi:hypothetical protein